MRAAHEVHVMPPMTRSNGTTSSPVERADVVGAGVEGVVDMAAQSAWWSSAAGTSVAVAAAITLAVWTDPSWEKSKNRPYVAGVGTSTAKRTVGPPSPSTGSSGCTWR